MMISQTLIASIIWTVLFMIFALIYIIGSKQHHHNKFVTFVDMTIERVMEYLTWIGWSRVNAWAIALLTWLFFYIAWSNVIWLVWDMIVLAVPIWHDYFRPAWSDLMFNWLLALLWVGWAIIYGFYTKWRHHIEHYIPFRGIWIVPKVNSVWTFFGRIGDMLMWLLIWTIELLSEWARMMSLSLRLFANLFVWMILLWLVTQSANALFGDTPFLLPMIMFAYEIVIWILQAYIFSLLVTVYFKLASDHH